MTAQVDISANRRARNYGRREQLGRVLWWLATPLFRFSPRLLWGWRAALLRLFGAEVGAQVHVFPSVRIAMPWNLRLGDQVAVGDHAILYALGVISIGDRATVSQRAHLCAGTHDHRDPARPLLRQPIGIGADAWVCADAFVGPKVRIGPGAILGARAVAMRDLPGGTTGYGNPMRIRQTS